MIKVHLLGHVHVMQGQNQLVLSAKGKALLTYLALEGTGHHREHLADLLWNSHDALSNLRVELTRLRQHRLDLFPYRSPILKLDADTDLAHFLRDEEHAATSDPGPWLARLRGLPLSGLEDLGSSAFQTWLEGQRASIIQQVEDALGRVHARLIARGERRHAALVRARADTIGLELARHVVPMDADLYLARPESRAAFTRILRRAEQEPQLLRLTGRRGSGRRTFVRDSLQGSPWLLLQVDVNNERRLFQASLAQALLHAAPDLGDLLDRLLVQPADANADLICLGRALTRSGHRVVLALHGAEHVSEELGHVLSFLLSLPMPLLVVLCGAEGSRATLPASVTSRRCHTLELPPIGDDVLRAALGAAFPSLEEDSLGAYTAWLQQQTGGSVLHLRALTSWLVRHGWPARPPRERAPLPPVVRDA
ncbi:hypothetical protein, partial [Deinococcus pimensis]|uniref:AfsR/SARP family transcriptional regulator n=1 Tax=Deinococcus pimensis TaxID=309888 RepID=UPI00047F65D9